MNNHFRIIPALKDRSKLNDFWNMGTNTCHAALWLRKDLQNHLQMAKNDLGFKYVRAHGILNDDMVGVNADGSFDYSRIIDALQIIVGMGLKPFIEFSSMPSTICSKQSSITKYKFFNSPPRDWPLWYRLIKGLMESICRNFDRDEIKQWYFEVWNEPNIDFWKGSQNEYFKLYDLAAKAVKETDSGFRVGGPATARTQWMEEFCRHVLMPSQDFDIDVPRCDFISTHAYPSDLEFLDSDHGKISLQNSNLMKQLFADARSIIDRYFSADFPLIIGEWNSSAGPLAENHDECNNGAFIIKTMIDLMPYCSGSLFWNLSDIYEECGFHDEPFHGGYGLITVDDLPKASFHAFKMLNSLKGEAIRLHTQPELPENIRLLSTIEGNILRIVACNYKEPNLADADDEYLFEVTGIKSDICRITRVLPEQGSAYESWVKMGRPEKLMPDLHQELKKASPPNVIYKNSPILKIKQKGFAMIELELS